MHIAVRVGSTAGCLARHSSCQRSAWGTGCCAGRQRPASHVAAGRRRHHEPDYDEVEEYAQEPQYEQGIDPTPPAAVQDHKLPLYVTIPAALLVVFALFRVFKKIQSRGYERWESNLVAAHAAVHATIIVMVCRSVTGLVSRGLVNEEKGTNKGDPYYQGNMTGVCRRRDGQHCT